MNTENGSLRFDIDGRWTAAEMALIDPVPKPLFCGHTFYFPYEALKRLSAILGSK